MTVQDLPAVNASLNGLATVFLVLALVFIRRGRVEAHRRAMLAALTVSVLFLASYLTYHYLTGSTRFQTRGWIRTLYLGILLSHTVLAAAIVPLVLVTLTRALRRRFDAHRRWARWTWPLWFYVSITGVVIYFMLYHLDPRLTSG